jgi:hypothetical protein
LDLVRAATNSFIADGIIPSRAWSGSSDDQAPEPCLHKTRNGMLEKS